MFWGYEKLKIGFQVLFFRFVLERDKERKKMIKLMILYILLFVLFQCGEASDLIENIQGTCGNDIIWSFNVDNSSLRVSGSAHPRYPQITGMCTPLLYITIFDNCEMKLFSALHSLTISSLPLFCLFIFFRFSLNSKKNSKSVYLIVFDTETNEK